jgi:hypothetical protein
VSPIWRTSMVPIISAISAGMSSPVADAMAAMSMVIDESPVAGSVSIDIGISAVSPSGSDTLIVPSMREGVSSALADMACCSTARSPVASPVLVVASRVVVVVSSTEMVVVT